jgi:hypothetical protein
MVRWFLEGGSEMNRYRSVEDVDSVRVAYGSTGAMFAAALIIICAMFWHSRAGATQGVDAMEISTQSLAFQAGMGSAFPFN